MTILLSNCISVLMYEDPLIPCNGFKDDPVQQA